MQSVSITANVVSSNPALVLDTILRDKVCQWLAARRWVSPGTPVSSTNKYSHKLTYRIIRIWAGISRMRRPGGGGRRGHIFTTIETLSVYHLSVYSMQHYVIKFVSDLRQVGGLLRVHRVPPPIKLIATM